MSRAWTQKEVQDQFLTYLWDMVEYWDREVKEKTTRERLEGLLFSFLVLLDGGSGGMPAYDVVPSPHPSDKVYRINRGENYYGEDEESVTVHGSDALHELMYDHGRKLGLTR